MDQAPTVSENNTELNALPSHDWRLKLVVFFSGAVLMGLEMAGSRVLAIHFGSSIYVWGAIISVFLAALASGYYLGGIVADRRPTFYLLNLLLFIAGCWLLVTPIYANRICLAIRSVNFGERFNPLIATVMLFGGPSVLLGTVSPFAVRLAARSVARIGNLSGRLYALSTVGSIVGTLVTAFWLIPLIGVRTLLHALGATLILIVLIVLPKSRTVIAGALIGAMILVVSILLTGWLSRRVGPNHRMIVDTDSAYHHIQVIDNPSQQTRSLTFNNYTEGTISLSPPYPTRLAYTDGFHLARIFRPDLKKVLIIGGGGGVGARAFEANDPNVVVDLVEIDPKVVQISFDYFFLKPSERLRVHTEDGRSFIRRTPDTYDLIVLDAYTIGGQIPFHLTTQEFLREVKAKLNPGGLVLANIINALEGPRSKILRSQYKTINTVFDHVYLFPIRRGTETIETIQPMMLRNVLVIAVDNQKRWSREDIVRSAEAVMREGRVNVNGFLDNAQFTYMRPLRVDDVPVLTDDYAPVDTMVN